MAPAGKTPKTKGRRRQVEEVHGVLPDREEDVREDVNEDTMQIRHRGREYRRRLTSRENHRWSDEGGEPGETPMWAGSGMERE